MKIKYLLLIIVIVFSFNVSPQNNSGIPASFVDIGFGSRPMGMGGAFTGLANDINALMWNPAGLVSLKSDQAAFSFANQLNLIQYHFLAFGMPLSSDQGIGLGLIYSGDKAMTEMTFQAGYAISLFKDFSAGINLKYRYSSFGKNTLDPSDFQVFEQDEIQEGISDQVKGNGSGFGLDMGMLYRLNEEVQFGLMVKDIYSPIYWNSHVDNTSKQAKGSYSELIPTEVSLGTSLRLIDNVIFDVDYSPSVYKDASSKLSSGIEAKLVNIISLRAGFQHYPGVESNEKYMFGLGLDLKQVFDLSILIDYTYMIENLANTQRFSLGFSF
jgi:hypothetical protein